jgi:hypothetical protein
MDTRAVRAVGGMVETGFLPLHIPGKTGWRRMANVALPPHGPLTEEKGTAMVKNMIRTPLPPFYWFACLSWDDEEKWIPAFNAQGTSMLLGVSFATRVACEAFIETQILRAADIGPPRSKEHRSQMISPDITFVRDEEWDS